MSESILEATFSQVLRSPFTAPRVLVVWSLGEPLSAPIAFYQKAFELANAMKNSDTIVTHHFQTNGTLLTDAWCEFIKSNQVAIGVSIDGPRELHDESRQTRSGRGTFDSTMRGIRLLQDHGIDFGVISVIRARTLDQPDILFDFYEENGFSTVGLNVEEIDGANKTSSLDCADVEVRFRHFIRRILMRFRESTTVKYLREYRPDTAAILANASTTPSSMETKKPCIVSVDVQGNFTLLGPELLGMKDNAGNEFTLGNFMFDSLTSIQTTERFQQQYMEVEAGVAACRSSCHYFPVCGGGPPSNKFFENGSFISTETLYCRLMCQAIADVTVDLMPVKGEMNGIKRAE